MNEQVISPKSSPFKGKQQDSYSSCWWEIIQHEHNLGTGTYLEQNWYHPWTILFSARSIYVQTSMGPSWAMKCKNEPAHNLYLSIHETYKSTGAFLISKFYPGININRFIITYRVWNCTCSQLYFFPCMKIIILWTFYFQQVLNFNGSEWPFNYTMWARSWVYFYPLI